jgi:TonB-dependent receptor
MNYAFLPFYAHANRRYRKQLFLTVLAIACTLIITPARAEGENATGAVAGTVYNATNDLPIGKVLVSIAGSRLTTLTDESGQFQFVGVPAGKAKVQVSYLGFDSQSHTATVGAGQTVTIDFQLSPEGQARGPLKRDEKDDIVVLEKYRVVADSAMSAQAIAMNEQRHASSITNVVALDELPGQGTENIGDYIRFLPGVAILDDGENPGTLALGGFPADKSNISLDGGSVASTGAGGTSESALSEGGGRTMSLRDVPMVNIERVEITKVPTPDKPASGLGGSMNLVTKGLLGVKKARLDWQLYMTLNSTDGFTFKGGPKQAIPQLSPNAKQPSYSINAVLPASRRLAFSVGYSKSWRQRPTDDTPVEYADWNLRHTGISTANPPIQGNLGPKDIAIRYATWSQLAQISSTENIQAGVEFRLSRNDTLALTIQHREVSSEQVSSRMRWQFSGAQQRYPVVPAGADPATTTQSPGFGNATITMGQAAPLNYYEGTDTTHMTLRYRHTGPKWRVEAQGVYSSAVRERDSRVRGYAASYIAELRDLNMTAYGINTTDSILPTRFEAIYHPDQTQIDPYDGETYRLTGIREEYARYKTDNIEGRIDAERIFNRFISFKTGASFTRQERDNQRMMPQYNFNGDAALASATGMQAQSVSLYDFVDDSIDIKMNGQTIRWLNPVKVYNLFKQRPEFFELSSGSDYYQMKANNSKRMIEDIEAGYLRFDLRLFSNRLHTVFGARYERTNVEGWAGLEDKTAIYQRDADGNRIPNPAGGYLMVTDDPAEYSKYIYTERGFHDEKSYDGIYPSVNMNFSITQNLIARAAYARTIGRPNVNDIVAGFSIPDSAGIASTVTISVANPGLEPWTADSFHLSLDSYNIKGGFGSIGVYKKKISKFIGTYRFLATDAILRAYGVPESEASALMESDGVIYLSRRENIGNAELTGFEMSYRQDLLFLPSWLRRMQLWVNYTHIEIGGEKAEEFMGFTPDAFSAGLNYIRPRFSLRVACAYQGETKAWLEKSTTNENLPLNTTNYQAAYTRWSVNAEYSFSRALTLFANCSDVLGKDLIIYRRASDTPDFAQKYIRRTNPAYITIGVKGSF